MMPEYWEVLDGLSNIGSKQTVKDRDITMTSPLREFLCSQRLSKSEWNSYNKKRRQRIYMSESNVLYVRKKLVATIKVYAAMIGSQFMTKYSATSTRLE